MEIYAAKHKNLEDLRQSSSGGAFTAISDYILDQQGVIVAPMYNNKTNRMEYFIATDKLTRNQMRGSKYIQTCREDKIFSKVLELSRDDILVLFVGTPCFVDGIRSYLLAKKANIDNIVLVDIICHGTESPKVWLDYLKERKIYSVDYITFKNKKYGWSKPIAYLISNGKKIYIDDYVDIFYSGNALRPSCHVCPYASLSRPSDITIGDYWGVKERKPEFASEDGVLLMIASTQKGADVINNIKKSMHILRCEADEILQPNLQRPTAKSQDRDKFWKLYKDKGLLNASREFFLLSDYQLRIRRIKKEIKHRLGV